MSFLSPLLIFFFFYSTVVCLVSSLSGSLSCLFLVLSLAGGSGQARKRIQHGAGGAFPVSLCLKAQRSPSFVLRTHQDLRFKEKQEPSLLAPSGVPTKYNQKKKSTKIAAISCNKRCPERGECLESGRNHSPPELGTDLKNKTEQNKNQQCP